MFDRGDDLTFDPAEQHVRASVNPEVVDHDAPAHTAERLRVGDAFAGRRGNGITQVAFTAEAKPSTPEELRAMLDVEDRTAVPLIKKLGIKPE